MPEEEKLPRELLDETDEEWYKAKHRRMSDPEVKAINAIPISTCPWCESQSSGRQKAIRLPESGDMSALTARRRSRL